jgi:acetoin utilization deacetylase AcuC-like enzyme/GNAT superfamily N-acetyltransferase
MIRFRRLFDLSSTIEQREFADAAQVFRAAFPGEIDAIPRMETMLREGRTSEFEPVLLLTSGARGKITGLAFVFYFPDIRYAYLQYIASDPSRSARGIGAALYEAVREFLVQRHAHGLLLDVPPADAAKLKDKSRLPVNLKRLDFYARFDLCVVTNSLWDKLPNPRNDGYLTTLLYDPLGRPPRLTRSDARRAVRRILVAQYGYDQNDPFVEQIVGSFSAEPASLAQLHRRHHPETSPAGTRGPLLRQLKLVVAERHEIHHLKEKGYVERPVRVRAILRGIADMSVERVETRRFGEEHITAIHHPSLVRYLKAMSEKLSPAALVYPEVFPIRRPDRIPAALEDRAGYFCADTFTPLTKNSYIAARECVNVALTCAELVAEGERLAYALCRPPGHHAERRVYGGFCYFNNSAAAAHFLSRHGKVALLDIDYHHGNGAQDIFYSRADVLTLSIHGHPRQSYPYFSGYADEHGDGAGLGFNVNYPLDPPIDDDRYLLALEKALGRIQRFRPDYLVLSLGFDIMRGDPTGTFAVTPQGMRRIGRRIGAMHLPTLIVQEGGYSIRNLRLGSRAFFQGLSQSWYVD